MKLLGATKRPRPEIAKNGPSSMGGATSNFNDFLLFYSLPARSAVCQSRAAVAAARSTAGEVGCRHAVGSDMRRSRGVVATLAGNRNDLVAASNVDAVR